MIRSKHFRLRVCLTLLALSAICAAQTSSSTSPAGGNADLVKQGQKLNGEGKQDDAIALYKQALQSSPDSYDAHLAWGIALDLKGDYAEARHHLEKAVTLASPENKAQALRSLAVSYAFESKAQEASKYEQQVFDARMAKQDFIGAAEIANELARIDLESGDLDAAYKWYKTGNDTALKKTDMSEADKGLWAFRWEHAQARILARRGRRDDAEKHVTAAKEALDKANNPDQAPFYPYLTGYVAFYLGDAKTAVTELQKANLKDPFILGLLGQAYEKMGDKSQAAEYYGKVMAVNTHNPANAFARPLARKKLGAK